jgi:hypothetical protein
MRFRWLKHPAYTSIQRIVSTDAQLHAKNTHYKADTMSIPAVQLSNTGRRLLWRNQRREYQESIAGSAKPHYTRSSRASLKWMRLWDPVVSLPLELALMCVQEALPSGKDYPAALIELTLVSTRWRDLLFSAPRLWTQIDIWYSAHDLMAITSLFLHLSANAALGLIVRNTLGSEWEDIRSLLLPHIHRIRSLTLGNDPPIYYDSPYTGAAYISLALDTFNSLNRLPGLVSVDFGLPLRIVPSQLKTLDLPSDVRISNAVSVSLENMKVLNRSLYLCVGREMARDGLKSMISEGPGILIFEPDHPSGGQIVDYNWLTNRHYDISSRTVLSLNSSISSLADILDLLGHPGTSTGVSISSSHTTFISTSTNMCRLCYTTRGSLLSALGCVRSHFGLHPFQCPGCRTCNARKGYVINPSCSPLGCGVVLLIS